MPVYVKAVKRKRSGVRKIVKSAKKRNFNVGVPRNLSTSVQYMPGVAEKQIVKLRYFDQFILDAGIASAVGHIFRANSIFDPNYTDTGHQPMGRDTWMTFYNHYTVISSKIKVTAWSALANGADINAGTLGIYLDDTATSITQLASLMEQGKSRVTYLSSSHGKQSIAHVTSYYNAKKNLGLQDIRDNRALVGASFGNSPSEAMYFHVFYGGCRESANPSSIWCQCEIEYTVYLTEPKSLTQS